MKRRSLVGIAVASILFATDAQAQNGIVAGVRVTATVPGEMPASKLSALAPRVATISTDSSEIHMRLGDTLSLSTISLVAHDSAGTELGRFRTFDSAIKLNGILMGTGVRRYVAVAEGSTEFTLSFPRRLWVDRSDEPAFTLIKIVVVP